jgi:hypothetical protein
MIKKILVLDLDETLVSSLYASNINHADQLLQNYGHLYTGKKFNLSNDGWYVTFERSWSQELIKYFQLVLGLDNVCILSWGTNRYVLEVVKLLGLGISPNNIFTREDMGANVPRFKNQNVVLVDNENYQYHLSGPINKVNFLHCLEEHKLIQTPNFDARYFDNESDILLEELISKIESAFEIED